MNRKSIILLAFLLFPVFLVSTVMAQDSIMDQPAGPIIVLSEEMTPDGLNTTIEIPNTKDTFVSSNQPNTNYGSASTMLLGYSLGGQNLGAVRPMLQFDTNSIPKGAIINSATLRIYLAGSSPSNDSSMGFKGVYLVSSWSEHSVTWNNHQPQWGSEIGIGSASSQIGWQTADVKPMVNEWVNGGRPNFGFIIIGDEAIQNRLRSYFTKDAGNGLYSRLIVDYTVSKDTTPPVANVLPLPKWSPANFVVQWQGSDPNNPDGTPGSGIKYYDIFDSTNGGANWNIFRAQVTSTQTNFEGGKNLYTYSFTARAADNAGNVGPITGVQASTTVDAVPPVATVNPLPVYTTSPSFTISWTGTDGESGIANYDVEWRTAGGQWQTLYENTTLTSYLANGAQDGATYQFRARATDNVGNTQPWTDVQAQTTVSLAPTSTITGFNPPIVLQIKSGPGPNDSFIVYWQGYTAPGTGPLTYNLRYQIPGGGWQNWTSMANTSLTSGVFNLTETDPDGEYNFQVAARNNAGQQEQFTGTTEGTMVVDRNPPYIEPAVWMPLIVNKTES